MAKNTQLSNTIVNSQAASVITALNSGSVKIYTGTQPADANTAISTQTLLVSLPFAATSGTNSNGVITFTTAGMSATAAASGTATWYRCFQSDGTTVVMDGTVDVAGNTPNMALSSTAISSGATVSLSSFTHTVNRATAGQ